MAPVELNVMSASYCNETDETAFQEPGFKKIFDGVYYVIYVVGIGGNIFSFIVWRSTKLRFVPVAYFQAICLADSLVLFMHPFQSLHEVHVPGGACQLLHLLFLAVQLFAIFLVLGLSVERFIDLIYPLQAQRLLSYSKTVRWIGGLAVLAVALSSGEAYIWHVQHGQCQLRHSPVAHHVVWAYTMTVLLLLFVTPLIVVVVLNALIHYNIRRRRRSSVAFGTGSMAPKRLTLNNSLAFMACYLAFWEITYAAVHAYGYLAIEEEEKELGVVVPCSNGTEVDGAAGMPRSALTGRWHSYQLHSLPLMVLDVLALTSYVVDVLIYTVTSHTFSSKAKELCSLLFVKCCSGHSP